MRGRLDLQLRETTGGRPLVARRRATNTVMQSGADLVARLFAGQGAPISHMGVGTSDVDPDLTTTTGLVNGDGGADPLAGDTTTAIPPEVFSFEVDDVRRLVVARARATLPAPAAVGRIREAGLLARDDVTGTDVLYNRVTFAPVDKADDHELTLFWEVEFPFGDLQWLS